jgi:uncharacterized protein with PIN domain
MKAEIILHSDLAFFTEKRYKTDVIRLVFRARRSVKDLLESIGIPHVEIGRVIINGDAGELSEVIDGDVRLEVFPVGPGTPAPEEPEFLLDVHLGKLAANLRMLGFSADYSNRGDDAELEEMAVSRGLVLLSCDRGLLMRKRVEKGMVIRSRNHLIQTSEVLSRYALVSRIKPLTRCISCNGLLGGAVAFDELPAAARAAIPEKTRSWCREYFQCRSCGRPYWRGSHIKKIRDKIDRIMSLMKTIPSV